MGSSKPKPIQTPFQQQQEQKNTFGYFSPYGQQGVDEYLNTPLDFGKGDYTGDAYKDVKSNFNLDPGVGRRTDLAEQEAENRNNSALNFGVPSFIRQANQAKERRDIQAQGAAEAQQAEYGRQGLEYQSSVDRARMRDAAELAKANMTGQGTIAELARRERLLPQILQTGGSGSSSGYNTVVTQPQPGFFSNLGRSLVSPLYGGLFPA